MKKNKIKETSQGYRDAVRNRYVAYVVMVIASSPEGVQNIVMSMSICLSVCLAYLENYTIKLYRIFIPVALGGDSILLG